MSAKTRHPSDEQASAADSPCGELPASACLIAQEQFAEVRRDVSAIKAALLGNEALGHTGLVHRVKALEHQSSAHDKKLVAWTAILTAAGGVAVYLKEKLIR
jgi:hypothetical protein